MHWDRLFEDLEGQLASEWEAERAALDAESERLRIARLDLRGRLRMLCAADAEATIELADGRRFPVRFQGYGADWIAVASRSASGVDAGRSTFLIPHHAVGALTLDHGVLLASLEESVLEDHALRERMTFGFVLRDLARRRVPVHISTRSGGETHGTIDRAAADHLDLAVHETGEARRAGAVQGFRVVPFASILAVRTVGDQVP